MQEINRGKLIGKTVTGATKINQIQTINDADRSSFSAVSFLIAAGTIFEIVHVLSVTSFAI